LIPSEIFSFRHFVLDISKGDISNDIQPRYVSINPKISRFDTSRYKKDINLCSFRLKNEVLDIFFTNAKDIFTAYLDISSISQPTKTQMGLPRSANRATAVPAVPPSFP
jgi:hypothetical protein